jgi:neutral ceramidase
MTAIRLNQVCGLNHGWNRNDELPQESPSGNDRGRTSVAGRRWFMDPTRVSLCECSLMRKRNFLFLVRLGCWFAAAPLLPAMATDAFQAGFATADITPPTGGRRAGGYTELVSTGVHDPLFAKAMVLSQGAAVLAFVGNDLCSVPRELTDRARKRASEQTGIPFDHIVITATHTHGGPEYYGPLRDVLHARALKENGSKDPHEPVDYQNRLVERWAEVIVKAHAARKPMTLSVVVPQQEGLAFNRRFLMKDGSTGWNPGKLNTNIFRPLGPTDPDLPFVLVRDSASRTPVGSLTVFAMHTAIYGGTPFGACYPAHLQTQLRQRLGAPEFVSLFGEGCAGDVNHVDVSSRDPHDSKSYPPLVGERLAATIHTALPLARPIAEGQLAMRSVTVHSPVAPVTEAEYAAAKELMKNLDRGNAPFLTVVDAWRKMFRHEYWQRHGGRLPQEVQAIRLDRDTAIVTLPHEVMVELGLAIKSASPFRTTIVISLANDLDFYIPTRRAFEEGHYEPTTCPLEPGCGELLVQAALKLLNELKP